MPAEDSSLCYGFKMYNASYRTRKGGKVGKGVAFNSLICRRKKKGAIFINVTSFFPVRKIMYLATEKLLLKYEEKIAFLT